MRVLIISSCLLSCLIAQSVQAAGSFTISAVTSTSTNSSLELTFTTNIPGTTSADYGTTSTYGSTTPISNTAPMVTQHEVTISSLSPCTVYSVQLDSTDQAGDQAHVVLADHLVTTGCIGNAVAVFQDSINLDLNNPSRTISLLPSGRDITSILLSIPGNVTIQPTTLQLIGLPTQAIRAAVGAPLDQSLLLNTVVQFTTNAALAQAITFQITYPISALLSATPSSVQLQMYNLALSTWSPAPDCSLVTYQSGSAQQISCHVAGSGLLALTGKIVQPNSQTTTGPLVSTKPGPTVLGMPVTGTPAVIAYLLIFFTCGMALQAYLVKRTKKLELASTLASEKPGGQGNGDN